MRTGGTRAAGGAARPRDPSSLLLVLCARLDCRDCNEWLHLEKALLPHASHVHQVFDLLAEDSQLNVYRGELEVRPPDAPTTEDLRATWSAIEADCENENRRGSGSK
jgi:hypothetical protein